MKIKRGEIFIVDFGQQQGSQQSGIRPAICLQNDIGNSRSNTTIVACITTKKINRTVKMQTHVFLPKGEGDIVEDSVIMLEQVFTVDKSQVLRRIGGVSAQKMREIENAHLVSVGIGR